MQNYKEINGNDYVKDSRTTINETMRSIQSMNSGTVFPTTNLFEGMKCYRTDLKKTYTLTDVENNTWVEDDTASKLSTARKISITGDATGAANFDGTGDISINTTVNESKHAASATTVNATAPNGGAADLAFGTMATNDYARIRVYGKDDNGALEIATADGGNEPIYARQYSGPHDWLNGRPGTVTNEAAILDSNGNTKFPKNVTAASFTGPLKGNADTATNADKLDGYHASDIISKIYPVGSIYMSMSATNPATLFGVGTWARISQGRMLLGADDSTYKAGATGGEAAHTLSVNEMPAHSHGISTSGDHTHNFYGSDNNNGPLTEGDGLDTEGNGHFTHNVRFTTSSAGSHTHTISNSGGGAAHNNMPPYLVCYIWQRTA